MVKRGEVGSSTANIFLVGPGTLASAGQLVSALVDRSKGGA